MEEFSSDRASRGRNTPWHVHEPHGLTGSRLVRRADISATNLSIDDADFHETLQAIASDRSCGASSPGEIGVSGAASSRLRHRVWRSVESSSEDAAHPLLPVTEPNQPVDRQTRVMAAFTSSRSFPPFLEMSNWLQ